MDFKVVEIDLDKTEDLTPEDGRRYCDVLNGLVSDCMHGGYCAGHRNEMILALTVSSWMLGLYPPDVLKWFVQYDLIDPDRDDERPMDRMNRMLNYTDSFDWDYMLGPEFYENLGDECVDDGTLPVFFKVKASE